jgi:hypothetical protein
MRTAFLLLTLAAFVLAGLVGACDSSGTIASAPDAGPECGAPDENNPDACPATYDTAALPATCAPLGLVCLYPGQGDGTSTGCASPAALSCLRNEDAEVGQWVPNQ